MMGIFLAFFFKSSSIQNILFNCKWTSDDSNTCRKEWKMVSICHGHDQSCAILDHSHILFEIITNRLKLVESIVIFFFTYSSCQYDIDSGHSACSARRFTCVELTTKPSDRMTDVLLCYRSMIKFLDKIWWHHHWCETSKSATCASLEDEIISLND